MPETINLNYPTANGHMTERIRQSYIQNAVERGLLPVNAHRMADVISLGASPDRSKPIQFWQLYSVLGADRIVAITTNFYQRVFADETWFSSVFARVGPLAHHVSTQSAMWIDVMGGGQAYHGGEFRLNFHHTHNAFQLMNDRGAERWVKLMLQTLDDPTLDFGDDPRIRPALNSFLAFFLDKYADDFKFENRWSFGEGNASLKRKINFLNLSESDIEALTEAELKDGLAARGIDVNQFQNKTEMVNHALRL